MLAGNDYIQLWITVGVLQRNGMDMENDETENGRLHGPKDSEGMDGALHWLGLIWARIALHCWNTPEKKITWTPCNTHCTRSFVYYSSRLAAVAAYRSAITLNDQD